MSRKGFSDPHSSKLLLVNDFPSSVKVNVSVNDGGDLYTNTGDNETTPLVHPSNHSKHKSQNRSKNLSNREYAQHLQLKYGPFHPKRRFYAYCILLWTCLFSTCGYFIYDCVGAIQDDLQKSMNITPSQFGLLYSVYSFPNCILPFFGGILLDKFGVRFGSLLCCALVFIGSMVVAISPTFDSFYMMLAGRLIYGLGAETSYVAQNSIIVAWFSDKEMALAMGLSVSAGRLGTWLTFNANPLVVTHFKSFRYALYLGACFGILEFIAAIVYYVMDANAERITKKFQSEVIEGEQPIDIRDVRHFSAIFWLLTVCASAYYAVVFPFESTAGLLLSTKYKYTPVRSGEIVSLLPLTSMLLSPVFGLIVDKIGKRVLLVILGIIAMTLSLLQMVYTPWSPIPAIIIIGLAYSLVPSAMWPCLPMVIDDKYISTAFGLLSSVLNLGLFLSYYLQGWINQLTESPSYQLLFYTGISGLGGVVAISWYILDFKRGRKCDLVYKPQVEPSS